MASAPERTGRLRLADTSDLDVHAQFGEINALGRIATTVSVKTLKVRLKLVFQISADRLAIRFEGKFAAFRTLMKVV